MIWSDELPVASAPPPSRRQRLSMLIVVNAGAALIVFPGIVRLFA